MNWRYRTDRAAWLALIALTAACRNETAAVPTTRASAGAANAMLDSGTTDKVSESLPRQPVSEERTIYFAWRPDRGSENAYALPERDDQHRMTLSRGIEPGGAYPLVIGLHGQPRRGQAPRSYAFPRILSDVSRELVADGSILPHVLVTPVFRFQGQNWPQFELRAFLRRLERIMAEHGIRAQGVYLVGHSGAAGCGGEGLNAAASVTPQAVGFLDTCLGTGFVRAVQELDRAGVSTLILHSVETAGFRPRQPQEYDPTFDFGKVYSRMGLRPSACPPRLPEVPLRTLAYRCASNDAATIRALVIDTGVGEKAHDAVVRVGMRYFLREYLSPTPVPVSNRGSVEKLPTARARSAENSD